jgi:hypothetical protein
VLDTRLHVQIYDAAEQVYQVKPTTEARHILRSIRNNRGLPGSELGGHPSKLDLVQLWKSRP